MRVRNRYTYIIHISTISITVCVCGSQILGIHNMYLCLVRLMRDPAVINPDYSGFMIQGRVVADGSPTGQFTGEPGVSQTVCDGDVSYSYRIYYSTITIVH